MSQKAQFLEVVVNVLAYPLKKASRQILTRRQVPALSVSRACQFMSLSRQAYYQRNRSADRRSEQGSLIAQVIREVRMRQPRLATDAVPRGAGSPVSGAGRASPAGQAQCAYRKVIHSFHRFYRYSNLLKPGPQQVLPCAPE